ncbi:MAG: hypothetical protein KDD33_11975 [Bdellovibrionales bacterium]|nr:hypothetical protein [Bdellovibrionales bacterium]
MKLFILLISLMPILVACQSHDNEWGESLSEQPSLTPPPGATVGGTNGPACLQSLMANLKPPLQALAKCTPATAAQLQMVNQGNQKKEQFLSACYSATQNSCWCDQLVRPNPDSIDSFFCTYGNSQVHQLIHPDESTWAHAFEAVKIVGELEAKDIKAQIIYNWWRPEPYNANVDGSPTRHPFGTAVDVRFQSKEEQDLAFDELCKMRAAGRIRAIGYYPTTALHFGVGDDRANTWGKSCP